MPGETNIEHWLPVRGARIDIKTTSLYVQDRWSINDRWSAEAGTRFELVRSDATGGIVGVDTQTIVPRLGVAFDPYGNGRLVLMSTYAHYAGKYGENQFATNTNVGNPDALFGVYVGTARTGPPVRAGLRPSQLRDRRGLVSDGERLFRQGPVVAGHQGVHAAGRKHDRTSCVREGGVREPAHHAGSSKTSSRCDTGSTTVSKGGVTDVFSNIVYRNSNLPQRRYQAIELLGRYSPTRR